MDLLGAVFVDTAIWVLWAALNYVDVVLSVSGAILRTAGRCAALPYNVIAKATVGDAADPVHKRKPTVVIVGASFAGLKVQQELAKHADDVDIKLIDCKSYFEYVPGVLRCLVEPQHFRRLSAPLSHIAHTPANGTEVITGEVVRVDSAAKRVVLRSDETVAYDYLVLATGSTYPGVIKADAEIEGEVTTTARAGATRAGRQQQWDAAAAALCDAKTVAIVGAGAVGVELAGEIATAYRGPHNKRVILVDKADTILSQGWSASSGAAFFKPSTIDYATRWLQAKGVELRLGTAITTSDATNLKFEDGSTLAADVVYQCWGARACTSFAWCTVGNRGAEEAWSVGSGGAAPAGTPTYTTTGKAVVVDDHLRVSGCERVFAAGDVCFHGGSDEAKQAHTAEVNGHLVAENVLRMVRGGDAPLLSYPRGVVGNTVTPHIYDLSLGKYDGSLGFNALVINGAFSAVIKWLLEYTKILEVAQRPAGVYFWVVLDAVGNLLGRTVLPTKGKAKQA